MNPLRDCWQPGDMALFPRESIKTMTEEEVNAFQEGAEPFVHLEPLGAVYGFRKNGITLIVGVKVNENPVLTQVSLER